jgi:DNA processing protein
MVDQCAQSTVTREIVHHLAVIPEVGPIVVKRIAASVTRGFCGWSDLYRLAPADFEQMGISPRGAVILAAGLADSTLVERERRLAEQHGIVLVACTDAEYPALLAAIHAPPPLLYVRGSVLPLAHTLMAAIVGSRDMNSYGREVVGALVDALVPAGWAVVSGGARGVDAAAHHATLRLQGITVAVLGSGLLRPYPREHGALFDAIVQGRGAVVSTYPLEANALPEYFPARNRVIAGLAQGCIVAQAAEKSGALITARYALDEGREVGAVPGSIFDPRSAGCHALLSNGATPITSGQRALEMFGVVYGAMPEAGGVRQSVVDPLVHLCGSGVSFDTLLATTVYSADQLHIKLWELQVSGKIEQMMNGNWRSMHL